jgi:hypothetical protein
MLRRDCQLNLHVCLSQKDKEVAFVRLLAASERMVFGVEAARSIKAASLQPQQQVTSALPVIVEVREVVLSADKLPKFTEVCVCVLCMCVHATGARHGGSLPQLLRCRAICTVVDGDHAPIATPVEPTPGFVCDCSTCGS